MTTAQGTDRPSSRHRAWWAVAVAAAVLILAPAGVWASDAFTDVPQGNVHHDAVGAVADAGVTRGCTPDRYCPADAVRRDQMASFMDRLGALSGQTPVVNAATAVTAENVEGMDAVLARLDDLEAENAALQQRVDDLEDGSGGGNGELAGRVEDLEAENVALRGEVDDLTALLAGVSRQDQEVGEGEVYDTLVFDGMNLQVVNGEEQTDSANGLGNLILGYNAPREADFFQDASERSGSHSLVVGDRHGWTSWGHILGGFSNDATGPWATVTGGATSTASGEFATVAGGRLHEADALHASVFGGTSGTASNNHAAVFGGAGNSATGTNAATMGGQDNTASGNGAATSGGQGNTASNSWASVSGGQTNSATANWASILGGQNQTLNTAHGIYPQE